MKAGTFALIPIEVSLDRRLTLRQMRVLIALFSFRDKATSVVWPSREAIARRTKLDVSTISVATSDLVKLGWLQKSGVGGHSKATRYTICVPEITEETIAESATVDKAKTVAESVTVVESATVAECATSTVAECATPPVAECATRKEHTNEHTNEQSKGRRASACQPAGLSDGVWQDFLAVRKAKRAPLTATALDGIRREAAKAGLSLPEAITYCAENTWAAFRADWYAERTGGRASTPRNHTGKHAAAARAIYGAPETEMGVIDVEATVRHH